MAKKTTQTELVDDIASITGESKTTIKAILSAASDAILHDLQEGQAVPLMSLGTLQPAERAARKGRNPSTGEEIDIPASVSARFKPSSALKAALN